MFFSRYAIHRGVVVAHSLIIRSISNRMKATLSNYRQSPRKTRLVADAVSGKSVPAALAVLAHMPKRAASPLRKLIESAVANAKREGIASDSLRVASVRVDKGIVMKRFMPRARGSGAQILKRTSRISVVLDQKAPATRERKGAAKRSA